MFNLNISVAHLYYPLAGIIGFPSALFKFTSHNQEKRSNYVGQEQKEHQKEHNGTTVIGVEFWREESWSECMPWERSEFIGGGKIYQLTRMWAPQEQGFCFYPLCICAWCIGMFNKYLLNKQTGNWHGGPSLPSKVVKMHPRTKLVWTLEGLLASPWIIPLAWTSSLPFLNVSSNSSLFYYMLLSSWRETGFSLTILGYECLQLALPVTSGSP